jgi:hypothetical protein
VLLLGVFFQVLLIFADIQDTPNKAVVEFSRYYFSYNPAMADRICEERRIVDDVDVVAKYIYDVTQDARERGFGLFYLRNCLYRVETHTISKEYDRATLRLVCEVKPWLRAFFTREGPRQIDEVFEVVKEDGRWKVCGDKLFALPEA